MRILLPLMYPPSFILMAFLSSFSELFLFVALPILAIAPFVLLLYKKRWVHSAMSVLFVFILVGIWFISLYLFAIFPQNDEGSFGNPIELSLNIFNTYFLSTLSVLFLLLLFLSLSSKMRHHLPILKNLY